MKLNRNMLVALVAVSVATLVASGTTAGAATPKKLKDIRIAAVVKGLDNPFFIGIKEGIEETALKYGVKANVQAAPGLNDDIGQANKLDSLAGQNYDCYIVIPISSNNLSQGIGKITKKGKAVINIDSRSPRLPEPITKLQARQAANQWLSSSAAVKRLD